MNSWLTEMLSAITIIQILIPILNIRNLSSDSWRTRHNSRICSISGGIASHLKAELNRKRRAIDRTNFILFWGSGELSSVFLLEAVENCFIFGLVTLAFQRDFYLLRPEVFCLTWCGKHSTSWTLSIRTADTIEEIKGIFEKTLVAIVKIYCELLEYVWVGLWRTDPTR